MPMVDNANRAASAGVFKKSGNCRFPIPYSLFPVFYGSQRSLQRVQNR